MNQNGKEAIKLKLAKAKSLLGEAHVLMENRFYTTVINRLYYSCFHATKALLLTKDVVPKTHNGVVNMLYQHFVKPGFFSIDHASFFTKLMQQRIEGDYSDFIIEDADTTGELIEPAQSYVAYIEDVIQKDYS